MTTLSVFPLIVSLVGQEPSVHTTSAGAFSGIFRLPTTSITPEGSMTFSYAGGRIVTERARGRILPDTVSDYSFKMGFLPNLEVGLSLLMNSPFNGIINDRAVAAKVAAPQSWSLPFDLAVGSTDLIGTRKRSTDYLVLGKTLGSLELYAGYGRGFLSGEMGGLQFNVTPALAVAAEQTGGKSMAGVKARLGSRIAAAAALDQQRRGYVSMSYTVPLHTPLPDERYGQGGESGPDRLARQLAAIGNGHASVEEAGNRWIASYDDVDARDPIETLGMALRRAVDYVPHSIQTLSVTVRRLDTDLVTIEGPVSSIRMFLQGLLEVNDFLSDVSIRDGGPDKQTEPRSSLAEHGSTPRANLTVHPEVRYQLGVRDYFPNHEYLVVQGTATLPFNLLLAANAQVTLNNSLDQSPVLPTPSVGLYRAHRFSQGARAMFGLERMGSGSWFASGQLALSPTAVPVTLEATYKAALERGNDPSAIWNVETAMDAWQGQLRLWAKYGTFRYGDSGVTVGMTRRFGRTEVSLIALQSEDDRRRVRRGGIEIQIPLPEYSHRAGGVQVGLANTAPFSYRPTEDASPSFNFGTPYRDIASIGDLTAYGRLTAAYVRQAAERLKR